MGFCFFFCSFGEGVRKKSEERHRDRRHGRGKGTGD